ncbi:MAG: hypothetical protein ACI9RG_000397 [Sulfurimonas sp.]|jgi:hypothetical protein
MRINRYIQEATLSGNLDMPVYESRLVNLIFGDFLMKKLILWLVVLGLLASSVHAKKNEQTICFS